MTPVQPEHRGIDSTGREFRQPTGGAILRDVSHITTMDEAWGTLP
jgi:hypothetical protein